MTGNKVLWHFLYKVQHLICCCIWKHGHMCKDFSAREMAAIGLMESLENDSVSQWMKIAAYCLFLPFKLRVISPSSLRIAYFIIFLLTTEAVINFLHRLPIRIERHHGSGALRAIGFPSASRDSKSCASILHFMKLRDGIEFLCLLWTA